MPSPEAAPSGQSEFRAKTPDEAAAELTSDQLAPVIPMHPELDEPGAPDQSTEDPESSNEYAIRFFDERAAEAQRRYDNTERMFSEAQAQKEPPASADLLANLRENADRAFISLKTWKRRAEAARNSQSSVGPDSSAG